MQLLCKSLSLPYFSNINSSYFLSLNFYMCKIQFTKGRPFSLLFMHIIKHPLILKAHEMLILPTVKHQVLTIYINNYQIHTFTPETIQRGESSRSLHVLFLNKYTSALLLNRTVHPDPCPPEHFTSRDQLSNLWNSIFA